AAAQELLVDRRMAAAAVPRRELRHDREPVVLHALLRGRRLMAIQTIDALAGVPAQLVFVDDRVLLAGVALGALAGGADERRRRLGGLDARPRAIDQEGAHDEREGDDHGNEDRPERHTERINPAERSIAAKIETAAGDPAAVWSRSVP